MRIEVNGVRLFFDVEGAKLVPDGPRMREKPTLILLHGGPGQDHSHYMPAFSQFADIAQVIYIDHRANGRSDGGDKSTWNLAQWADDVAAFCDALEIEKPIVVGGSFGGFVAMSYATRHPEHPAKLILFSTSASTNAHMDRRIAMFEEYGGPEIGALARMVLRGERDPDSSWDEASATAAWLTKAMPLYNRHVTPDPDARSRTVAKMDVLLHFMPPGGESATFDFLPDLARIQCPTLVIGGEEDPMTPIEGHEDIAAAIPQHLVRLERFANAGHVPYKNDPDKVFGVIREFILS